MERLPYAVKLVMALFGATKYQADFENLVLTTRRIASLEETVFVRPSLAAKK